MFRKQAPVGRSVRLHMNDGAPSIDGVLFGEQPAAGHYWLRNPKVIASEDQSFSLECLEYAVPAARVSGIQFFS